MIACIGAFDGFHKGHQRLFSEAQNLADRLGDNWCAVTFLPHPQRFFKGDSFKLLFSYDERSLLAKYLRVPELIELSFDEIARMEPKEFLLFLNDGFGINGIVVGEDFRFGRDRKGNLTMLREECKAMGWHCLALPHLIIDGKPVSSSRIRELLLKGQNERAEALLGYPFMIKSRAIRGRGRGRLLGFPTANLGIPAEKMIPKRGVYCTAARVDRKWWAGALSVGLNPTFEDGRNISVEVHLPGFEGELYGHDVAIFFVERLRDEKSFPSPRALVEQVGKDVEKCLRRYEEWASASRDFMEKWAKILDEAASLEEPVTHSLNRRGASG